jgi:hypothetical protein
MVESRADRRHRSLTMTCFGLKYDKVDELVTSQYRAYSSDHACTGLRMMGRWSCFRPAEAESFLLGVAMLERNFV